MEVGTFLFMIIAPDEILVKNLVDMGFPEPQSRTAFNLCGNNLDAAATLSCIYLLKILIVLNNLRIFLMSF